MTTSTATIMIGVDGHIEILPGLQLLTLVWARETPLIFADHRVVQKERH